MPERIHVTSVGAPDPEKRCSPVIEETDEEAEVLGQEVPEEATVCHFNDTVYRKGQYVCSGSELLRCVGGAWVREGSCDPDNP